MASGEAEASIESNNKLADVLSNKLEYDSYMGDNLSDQNAEAGSILEQELFGEDNFLNEDNVKALNEAVDDVGEGGSCSNQDVDNIEDIVEEEDIGSEWDEGEENDNEDDQSGEEQSTDDSGNEVDEGESDESEMLDEEDLDEIESELVEREGELASEKADEPADTESNATTNPDEATTSTDANVPSTNVTKKRKRKRDKKDKSSKKSKKTKNKPNFKRKNIRKIISEKDLDADTLAAQNEEFERKKRLNELKKSLAQKQVKEEKDSELKSLLQAAEDEATQASKNDDVILLDSKDVEKDHDKEVITLSSDEDDDVVMVPSSEVEEEPIEEEDMNNAGSHINDALNCRDELGRVLVNLSHPPEDPPVYLAPQIARAIKPHQIGGVRFLYDNVVESLERHQTMPGFGCILAHSMGLGKTIQMIAFIDIYMRYTKAKSSLCIVPINTLQNWMSEFNTWLPDASMIPPGITDVTPRSFKVFLLNDNYKTTAARAKVIEQWKCEGGVLLMGYEMYRLLSSRRPFPVKQKRSKKPAEPEVIDVDEEDRNKSLMIDIHGALVNPGPDIVICDEGHRIKNSHAGISQSLKNIKTRRRVVLTGYPLQNNLLEYWCMVDFVRPNFLGTKTEFSNMFERPMANGICVDSTDKDVRLSRHRAYVLHSLLEGFVQRRGHTVLNLALPEKHEYVFMIRMSPIQRALYRKFMDSISDIGLSSWANNNPLKSFSVCCKIWNHPDVLHKVVTQKKQESADDDLDLEGNEGTKKKTKTKDITDGMITYEWADELMKDYQPGLLEHSGKMVILNAIIEESLAIGDKLLVFSQSLFTLNLIEEYLSQRNVPRADMNEKWSKNRSYFRLDGGTSAMDRERLINQFNQPGNTTSWLFLLSTRAGCLGINLIGANRVVVLDASWNPCHDCQAICRVFRFGQQKNSYIYRLVSENTLERKIYDRQVNKQKMSDRVVDDLNPDNLRRPSNDLLVYQDRDYPDIDIETELNNFTDPVMRNVLAREGKWLTEKPFTHESLLLDRKELRLSKREKQLAKEGYARDKKLSVTYSRPSYAAFYPNRQGGLPILRNQQGLPYTRGAYVRPVASVKPMISTPVPMGFKAGGKVGSPLGSSIMRPGVSVHQVITTTEIVLPGSNTTTQAGAVNRIPPGQKVLVIKTLKGVYIRTADKKLFAVRSKTLPGPSMAPPGSLNLSSSSLTSLTASQPTGLTRPIPAVTSTGTATAPASHSIKIISSSAIPGVSGKEKKILINKNNNSAVVKAIPKLLSSSSQSPNNSSEQMNSELLSSIYSQTDTVNALLRNQDSDNSCETSSSDKTGETSVTFTNTTISSTTTTAHLQTGDKDTSTSVNPFGSILGDETRSFGSLSAATKKPVGISKPASSTITTGQEEGKQDDKTGPSLSQSFPSSSSSTPSSLSATVSSPQISNSMNNFQFGKSGSMSLSNMCDMSNNQMYGNNVQSSTSNPQNSHNTSSSLFNTTCTTNTPYPSFTPSLSSDVKNTFGHSSGYFEKNYEFGSASNMNKLESSSDLLDLCNQYVNNESQEYSGNQQQASGGSMNSNMSDSSDRMSRGGPPNVSIGKPVDNNIANNDGNNQNNTSSTNTSFGSNIITSQPGQNNFNSFNSSNYNMANFSNSGSNFPNNTNYNSSMSQNSSMMDQNYSNPYNMPAHPFFPYFPQHNYPMMGQNPGMGMHMGGMPLMTGFNPNMMGGMQPPMMSTMSSSQQTPTSTSNPQQSPSEQPSGNSQPHSSHVPPMHQSMYGMPYMNTPMNPFMYNSSPNSMYMPMMNPFSSLAAQQMNTMNTGMNAGLSHQSQDQQGSVDSLQGNVSSASSSTN